MGGVVFDPVRRLLIGPVNRTVAVLRLIPQADFRAAKKEYPGRETTEQKGAPYAMSREWFESGTNTPCIAPPWGELVAVSPDTGKIEWRFRSANSVPTRIIHIPARRTLVVPPSHPPGSFLSVHRWTATSVLSKPGMAARCGMPTCQLAPAPRPSSSRYRAVGEWLRSLRVATMVAVVNWILK